MFVIWTFFYVYKRIQNCQNPLKLALLGASDAFVFKGDIRPSTYVRIRCYLFCGWSTYLRSCIVWFVEMQDREELKTAKLDAQILA